MYKNNDKTNRARKIIQLKRLVLNSAGITRKEAAEQTLLDLRTVGAYLDELCVRGVICKAAVKGAGQGRPSGIYYSNVENLLFIGFAVRKDRISCLAGDFGGKILMNDIFNCDLDNISKLFIYNRMTDFIMAAQRQCPGRGIGGIGFNLSRHLQPPLAQFDMFSDFPAALGESTGAPVYRGMNITSVAYYLMRTACPSGRLAVIHPGGVLELGVLNDGFAPADHCRVENEFAHVCVEPDGAPCYCGGNGCLQNYVTLGAMRERLAAAGLPPDADFFRLTAENNAAALRVARASAVYMARGAAYVAGRYHPEKIFLLGMDEQYFAMCRKEFSCLPESGEVRLESLQSNSDYVDLGAVEMASFLSVRQYINNHQ